jgi:4-amino-4-deoxy-L-arabinose transferase-like glycosyltransferase
MLRGHTGDVVASISFLLGIVLALSGLILFFVRSRPLSSQERAEGPDTASEEEGAEGTDSNAGLPIAARRLPDWMWTALLVAVVAAGAFLRLNGLGERTLTHPEAYVPGIDLPEGISEPPPRHTLAELVSWHFHHEFHPQGYYYFMWVWTGLFGTSVWAMRLPSALCGIASIVLLYRVAALVYGRGTGLLAAAMLAGNGMHIHWSQQARMYSLACFLGLAATLLMLELVQGRRSLGREVAYIVVCFLGVFTEIMFWPLLATQILWTMACRRSSDGAVPRLVYLQTVVILLGAPLWTHAIYWQPNYLAPPTWTLAGEFLSFGFLFERDSSSDPWRSIPTSATVLLTVLTIAFVLRGVFQPARRFALPPAKITLAIKPLGLIAVGSILMVTGLVIWAQFNRTMMLATVMVPLAALMMPAVLIRSEAALHSLLARFGGRIRVPAWLLSPLLFLAVLPPLLMFGIACVKSSLAGRLLLLFIPYLLALIAAGVVGWSRRPLVAVPLFAFVAAIHILSIGWFQQNPGSPRDYLDLARKMEVEWQEGDLMLMHHRSWVATPLFYYLNPKRYPVATQDYQKAVASHPGNRVWVIDFRRYGLPLAEGMMEALAGFQLEEEVEARRASGLLYVRQKRPSDKDRAVSARTGTAADHR